MVHEVPRTVGRPGGPKSGRKPYVLDLLLVPRSGRLFAQDLVWSPGGGSKTLPGGGGGYRPVPEKGVQHNSAELSHSLQVLDRGRNTETGPKSIGIGSCRFVGTALGIIGLALSGLGADVGPKSTISGRILKSFPGPVSSAEIWGLLIRWI